MKHDSQKPPSQKPTAQNAELSDAANSPTDAGTSRRSFLKTAGAATFGVPFIITSSALGNADRPAASDRIVMGGIGIGNMGRGDQGAFLGRGDVQYIAACDVREKNRRGVLMGVTGSKTVRSTTTSENCWLDRISTPFMLPRRGGAKFGQ
jgi:hypothetical protein